MTQASYYQPNMAKNKLDPCIPAKGSLTIGYGSGGHLPQMYYMREGQDMDIGYLKLFISTQRVDLSHIEQKSPFKDAVRGGKPVKHTLYEGWDSILVPIVQKNIATPPIQK